MSGIVFTNKKADYSQNNFGNVSLAETYIVNGKVTIVARQEAYRTLFSDFKAAGFLTKFKVARVFFNASALTDSLNMVNPVLGAAGYQATFINDVAENHKTTGWTPDGSKGHYALSNFPVKNVNLQNFHIHAWNNTPELTDSVTRHLLGAQSSSNFILFLGRRVATSSTRGDIGMVSPSTALGTTGRTAGTGLLSLTRIGKSMTMYDSGVQVATLTKADTDIPVFPATDVFMKEGCMDPNAATSYTGTELRFLGYGEGPLSAAEAAALNQMLQTFFNSIV